MRKTYNQRKQSISRKAQPFFSEGGFRIDRKEEPQSFFQTKKEDLSIEASGIQKAAVEEEEPDIQRKTEEEEEIQRQPEEEEDVMMKSQLQE